MYSFFELSGTKGARLAAVASGSLIITIILMANAITPANDATTLTMGALA